QLEREDRPARPGARPDSPAHQLCELTRNREPEPAPRGDPSLHPVEAIEYAIELVGRDAGAIVLYLEPRAGVAGACPHHHRRPGRSVHEGICRERTTDLRDAILVADDDRTLARVDLEALLLALGEPVQLGA